jgi:hypothetical protein
MNRRPIAVVDPRQINVSLGIDKQRGCSGLKNVASHATLGSWMGITNVAAKSSFNVASLGYILCGLLSNTNAQAQNRNT